MICSMGAARAGHWSYSYLFHLYWRKKGANCLTEHSFSFFINPRCNPLPPTCTIKERLMSCILFSFFFFFLKKVTAIK
ncbi:hypothetical protein POVWA2_003550 [Plasmodium ovale wallikeri]|uniref:Uncharacterized protein n=1 Tax=Plasmodium ovale wallikeri TaxID=864142 RepID=A0A1A8YGM2_PLAOA|nr:hypothetical protein POVWA1_003400 [Plasmodium ovale wallikeri]SBT31330.1 hypothetical protein POVWA2_003550 [Plasmodium ovale wallikeri]